MFSKPFSLSQGELINFGPVGLTIGFSLIVEKIAVFRLRGASLKGKRGVTYAAKPRYSVNDSSENENLKHR